MNFSAISIPAAAIDKKTTDLLSGIENLDQILLEVDGRFFMAEAQARSRIDPSPEDLDERCLELRRATELVQQRLPSLTLHSRGIICTDQKYWVDHPFPSGVGRKIRGSTPGY